MVLSITALIALFGLWTMYMVAAIEEPVWQSFEREQQQRRKEEETKEVFKFARENPTFFLFQKESVLVVHLILLIPIMLTAQAFSSPKSLILSLVIAGLMSWESVLAYHRFQFHISPRFDAQRYILRRVLPLFIGSYWVYLICVEFWMM